MAGTVDTWSDAKHVTNQEWTPATPAMQKPIHHEGAKDAKEGTVGGTVSRRDRREREGDISAWYR